MEKVKKMIFVVEDESDILELVRMKLENAGFATRGFELAKPMLATLKSEHPDLIVLDLMLPDMDGLEVCKVLKSDNAVDKIPIVMLTARSDLDDKLIGLEYGRMTISLSRSIPWNWLPESRRCCGAATGKAAKTCCA